MEEQFSLKWNDYKSNFTAGFHDLLVEETMVDVTLATEDKFLQAHKIVLSVCSPYFKELFKVNPCKHPIVILKDVNCQNMSDMLEFMYKGEINIKHENLTPFLKLADTFKVKGLAGGNTMHDHDINTVAVQNTIIRRRNTIDKAQIDSDNDDQCDTGYQKSVKMKRTRKRRRSTIIAKNSDNSKTSTRAKRQKVKRGGDSSSDSDSDSNDPLAQLLSGKSKSQSVKSEFENTENEADDARDNSPDEFDELSNNPPLIDDNVEQMPQVIR